MKICSYENCEKNAPKSRYCGGHAYRFRNNLPMDAPWQSRSNNTGINCLDCNEPAFSKQLCRTHYRLNHTSDIVCAWPICNKMSSTTSSFCESCSNRLRNHRLKEGSIVLDKLLNNFACEACGSTDRLHIDHDHSCCSDHNGGCEKCIRGFLCFDCNLALGLLREDPNRLRSLLEYIERTKELV